MVRLGKRTILKSIRDKLDELDEKEK